MATATQTARLPGLTMTSPNRNTHLWPGIFYILQKCSKTMVVSRHRETKGVNGTKANGSTLSHQRSSYDPSEQIDKQIQEAGGWRANSWRGSANWSTKSILDPGRMKWDVGVYVHNGMVCAISAFKEHVKINFSKAQNWKIQKKLFQ